MGKKIIAVLLGLFGTICFSDPIVWHSIGPEGGAIRQVLVHPADGNIVYVLAGYSTANAIFKSTNAGANWKRIGHGLLNPSKLTLDDRNPSILYALNNGGVFKTTDGGSSWFPANSGLKFQKYVFDFVVHPRQTSILYAYTDTGIFVSTNRANTWHLKNLLDRPYGRLVLNPVKPSILYRTEIYSLSKIMDGGRSWSKQKKYPHDETASIAIDPGHPDTIYVGLYEKGPFKSTDGGQSWKSISNGFNTSVPSEFTIAGQTIYAAAGQGIFKTTNGGLSWTLLVGPSNDVRSVAARPSDARIVYAGSGTGIVRTADGGQTWKWINHGLVATTVGTILIDPHDDQTVYLNGSLKSTNGGQTFNATYPGVGIIAIDPNRSDTLYGFRNDILVKSTNGGIGWFSINQHLPTYAIALEIDPFQPKNLFVGVEGNIFKSSDAGSTWKLSLRDGDGVAAIAIDRTGKVIYVGEINTTDPAQAGPDPHILASYDAGRTWRNVFILNDLEGSINSIVIDPVDSKTVYAGTSGGLFRTSNGGTTWVSSDFSNSMEISALAVDPFSHSTIYAGTDHGIYRSSDRGAHWNQINEGLRARYILALAAGRFQRGLLYAGTSTGGAYSTFAKSRPLR